MVAEEKMARRRGSHAKHSRTVKEVGQILQLITADVARRILHQRPAA